jgi:hypothetical protein
MRKVHNKSNYTKIKNHVINNLHRLCSETNNSFFRLERRNKRLLAVSNRYIKIIDLWIKAEGPNGFKRAKALVHFCLFEIIGSSSEDWDAKIHLDDYRVFEPKCKRNRVIQIMLRISKQYLSKIPNKAAENVLLTYILSVLNYYRLYEPRKVDRSTKTVVSPFTGTYPKNQVLIGSSSEYSFIRDDSFYTMLKAFCKSFGEKYECKPCGEKERFTFSISGSTGPNSRRDPKTRVAEPALSKYLEDFVAIVIDRNLFPIIKDLENSYPYKNRKRWKEIIMTYHNVVCANVGWVEAKEMKEELTLSMLGNSVPSYLATNIVRNNTLLSDD